MKALQAVLVLFALALALALATAVSSHDAAAALLGEPTAQEIRDAVTELDVERARGLLSKVTTDSTALAVERARLSLYMGDCDGASAALSTFGGVKEAAMLLEVARLCARATAGSVVVEDKPRGLWIRLQDEADRALLPALADVAERARAGVETELGVALPRPLRIDLVRDLFSLSAVSGLPLAAAETTGTVAVARWGRVNMISPRAAPGGFPWADTLAHEITHLALSRATRDHAPLWLQEGLAKRTEIRWRPPRPFDADPPADTVAREALVTGQAVGVDKLGASIALLPSADAATIAFAEVASFMGYFIERNGRPALRLLLSDLKELGQDRVDEALRGVSGYDLPSWIALWQAHLVTLAPRQDHEPSEADALTGLAALVGEASPVNGRDRARRVRAAELLFRRGAAEAAAERLRGAVAGDPRAASLRWRLGRSLVAAGRPDDARPLFGRDERRFQEVDGPHAGWIALGARLRTEAGNPAGAGLDFEMAVALDPYAEDAACEGVFAMPTRGGATEPARLPASPGGRALCEAARKIPLD